MCGALREGAGRRRQRRREVGPGRGGGMRSVGCPGGKQQCAARGSGLDAPTPFLSPRRRTKKTWWASQRGPSLAPASTGCARGVPQGPWTQEPAGGPGSWLWPARWRPKEAPSLPACCSLRESPHAQAWAMFQRQLENPGSVPQTRSSFRKTDHLPLPLDFSFGSGPCVPRRGASKVRTVGWVGGRAGFGFVAGLRGGGPDGSPPPPPPPGLAWAPPGEWRCQPEGSLAVVGGLRSGSESGVAVELFIEPWDAGRRPSGPCSAPVGSAGRSPAEHRRLFLPFR